MLYLRNFKNFEAAELDLDQSATLLVGPNGSGKSNLIEAVELLSFLAAGHRLVEVTDIGRQGGIEVRGGLEACAKIGFDEFTLGLRATFSPPGSVVPASVEYEIRVRVRPEPRIVGEHLRVKGRTIPVFEVLPPEADSPSADNQVRYDNHARGGKKPVESIPADRSALSQYSRFASREKGFLEALALIQAVSSRLETPSVFDPIPRLMRNYERRTEVTLARNAYNISPVLFDLEVIRTVPTQNPAGRGGATRRVVTRQDSLARILKRIAQMPDEPFTSFDFILTPKTGDVMFAFKSGSQVVDARLISDGTLRALAILTTLEVSPANSRLILEEFDNGVHPSRVQVLTDALFECSVRNQLHVLATTHNPATMNALSREQLVSVLLVVSERGAAGPRLVRLDHLPGYIEFIESGRLGDLVTRRVYGQHLRPNYEEARKAGIEEWVNNLP